MPNSDEYFVKCCRATAQHDQFAAAIETAAEYLQQFGEAIKSAPTDIEAIAVIVNQLVVATARMRKLAMEIELDLCPTWLVNDWQTLLCQVNQSYIWSSQIAKLLTNTD